MQSDKIDQLVISLIKVQQNLKPAEKNRVNPHFKSPYADLEAVWKTCRQLLADNGLAVIQTTDFHDGTAVLVTGLYHVSGQWVSGEYPLNPEKPTPQSLGSAVKYARRYALESILGIVSSEDPYDDDGEAAMNRVINKPTLPQAPRKTENEAQPTQAVVGSQPEPPWPQFETSRDYASGDYVIKFSKHKGKTLNDLGPEQVLGFMNWLRNDAKKKNQDLSENAQEFIKEANLYLACKQKEDDYIPF